MLRSIYRSLFATALLATALISCSDSDDAEPEMASPTISSYSPDNATAGTVILITGENFGTSQSDVTVYFYDGAEAEIQRVSNTEIAVKVPGSAYVGPILVKVKNKEVEGTDFTVNEFCIVGPGQFGLCPRIKPA